MKTNINDAIKYCGEWVRYGYEHPESLDDVKERIKTKLYKVVVRGSYLYLYFKYNGYNYEGREVNHLKETYHGSGNPYFWTYCHGGCGPTDDKVHPLFGEILTELKYKYSKPTNDV